MQSKPPKGWPLRFWPWASEGDTAEICAQTALAEEEFNWDVPGPDTLTEDPTEHDSAVDHSKDGEARDTSVASYQMAFDWGTGRPLTVVTAQEGITRPVSKLPPPPPGAAEKAKKRERAGRGIEGGEDSLNPMSTFDKFNWDSMPLPGMGQIGTK